MKHVIFGGDGFVGRHLAARLVEDGEEVVVADIAKSNLPHYEHCCFVDLDVTDKCDIRKAHIRPDDMVYNLSAKMLSPIQTRAKRHDFFWPVNYHGTENIIETMAVVGAPNLVHYTTDMVYGHTYTYPQTEDHPANPIGEYGLSKWKTEELAWKWRDKGMNISLFRPRLIIGPGRLGILSKLFKLIDMNLPVPMIGSGKNPYQFVSVFDCAEAARLAWKAGVPNEVYNLGSSNPPPVRELLKDLIKYADSHSLVMPTPAWAVKRTLDLLDLINLPLMDPEQYRIADEMCILDCSKAERDLGWIPQHRDEDMLIAAYREYRAARKTANGTTTATTVALPSNDDHALKPVETPELLTVDDAKSMDASRMMELFKQHLNPGQLHFMKLLGFHKIKIESARGMYYTDQNGREILDFFGGFGSLALGHNHPRIIAARQKFQEEDRHEIAIAFMSQYASALASNLAAISPGDLDMVFLGSSGSEAMEAAVKVAERAAGPERSRIVYAANSFHGKTKGVLSLTDSELYRADFKLLDNTLKIPFGDIDAVRSAFEENPDVGVIVLETIQGGAGIIRASNEYWQELRALCDKHGVIWVADEVQCGMGRSGQFYAFQHAGVVPDVTALAKSLGAGKCAMAAMIASRDVYMKAYGSSATALIHGPATFGGIGEATMTAIEGLNVLYDENLIENAATQGQYLLQRLEALREKYPAIIKEVRGQGLMIGLELQDFSQSMPAIVRPMIEMLDDKLKGSLVGFIGSLLLKDYDILVAFTEYNRNVIRLEPPLICEKAHVDAFADALDDLLGRGVVGIVKDFLTGTVKG
jgi:acetylornithine/succinyldiaminopimelate/putrescine aminotransferase/nucleoside-diphosphate-sugar epimerase